MSEPALDNLRDFHHALVTDLTAHYAGRVETVAAYDPFPDADGQERRPLVTPAILIEVGAIGEGDADGTDRLPFLLTVTVHCILSFRTANIQLELREFAADVLAHVRHQRWGLAGAVQEPYELSAQAGEFRPGLAGFDSWQATWEQKVYCGPNVWAGGIEPVGVWIGTDLIAGDPDA